MKYYHDLKFGLIIDTQLSLLFIFSVPLRQACKGLLSPLPTCSFMLAFLCFGDFKVRRWTWLKIILCLFSPHLLWLPTPSSRSPAGHRQALGCHSGLESDASVKATRVAKSRGSSHCHPHAMVPRIGFCPGSCSSDFVLGLLLGLGTLFQGFSFWPGPGLQEENFWEMTDCPYHLIPFVHCSYTSLPDPPGPSTDMVWMTALLVSCQVLSTGPAYTVSQASLIEPVLC